MAARGSLRREEGEGIMPSASRATVGAFKIGENRRRRATLVLDG
jgi:hypothetical protein